MKSSRSGVSEHSIMLHTPLLRETWIRASDVLTIVTPLLVGGSVVLALLIIFQALGTQEIDTLLGPVQILTLLVFITFYVPCISTFAIMHRTLGRKQAWFSVLLSVSVALLLSALVRLVMGVVQPLLM